MKRKPLFVLCCIFFTTVFTATTQAQVTIGSGHEPNSGSLLQLKEKDDVSGGENSHRGFNLPRVKLSSKDELYPMFLTNPDLPHNETVGTSDPAYNPEKDEYKNGRDNLKASHIGLMVFNTTEDETMDLTPGINQWDGKQWNGIQNKMENAKFDPVDCSDIVANGVYTEGKVTTSANYLSINLNAIKAGAFAIMVTSGNGYFFYLSGVVPAVGKLTVNVPGQGIPAVAQTDKLVFSGMELVSGCEPEVEVGSSIAEYSLNCSSAVVNGTYIKGQALTSSNTITMNVTVAVDGAYSIDTPLTNGIRFSARGTFVVGTQTVTLTGSGTPTVNLDFPVTINSNSPQGNTTCSATVPVTLPAMTYAVIGQNVWSWAAGPRTTALTGVASFGPNGIVKIERLTELWNSTSAANALTELNRSVKPDIILYFSYGASPSSAIAIALANYINQGGCVIYGAADGSVTETNILLNGVFGISTAQAQIAGSGTTDDNDYLIANLPDDPIINGPFGNLSSRYFGEDNGSNQSIIVRSLPANSVQICSANNPFGKTSVDPDYSIVWYNNNKNFVYFGDCAGASTTNTNQNEYPAIYTSAGLPKSKFYGNYPQPSGSPSQFVYNSALELNVVTWALKKAAVSGINPH